MRLPALLTVLGLACGGTQALGLETIAELEEQVGHCAQADRVCLFNVMEQAASSEAINREMGPWLVYSIYVAGIEAAGQLEAAPAVDLLTRAISVMDEEFDTDPTTEYMSSPFHFLRAELCLQINDDECFEASAAELLAREIGSRTQTIEDEKLRTRLISGTEDDRFDPPIRWSVLKGMRTDMAWSGGPKYDWGDIAPVLDRDALRLEARLHTILDEAERRQQ